ncbi:hypothetical protein [Sulfolobus sp. S-194]|nr:hypothetical protein [Sulfolobus sp. S-194]
MKLYEYLHPYALGYAILRLMSFNSPMYISSSDKLLLIKDIEFFFTS